MLIPIMMAAFVLGIKGGLFFALLLGLTLVPFMPENVKLRIMQTPGSWLNRSLFYIITFWFVKSMLFRVKKHYYSKAMPPKEVEKMVLSIKNSEQYA
jgi:hypothetical protein